MPLNTNKIREDFPILNKKIIYFDNACVTLKPKQVIVAINRYYNEFPACGGRSLHRLAKKVTDEVYNSRKTIQKFLNSKKENEIIFTRNTTEGINLIMNSMDFEKGDVIISSDKEHNSNLLPIQRLSKTKGIKHEIIYSNEDNTFNIGEFREKINTKTKLVSIVHTSNLDGVTNPAKEIIKISHENNALVLLDAAQSVPHKEIDVKKLDVDFLAFSGHKMLGPSGTGVLYGKIHLLEKLKPFIIGGDTVKDTTYTSMELEEIPERFEAGLQDYAGIIGLAEAARYLMKTGKENIEKHEIFLNKKISEEFKKINEIKIIGPENPELRGGIISFNIKKMDVHNIAGILDNSANIMIRSGAHCVHSWFNAHKMKGSARASIYIYNTEEECNIFVENIKKIIKHFR